MRISLIVLTLILSGCATPGRLDCNRACALQDLACSEALIAGNHLATVQRNKSEAILTEDRYDYRCVQPTDQTALQKFKSEAWEQARRNTAGYKPTPKP